jgi:hypothetical protein
MTIAELFQLKKDDSYASVYGYLSNSIRGREK